MNAKQVLRIAAISGAIAVAFGAFGAHKLKELIDEKSVMNWETGVKYQMLHTLAMLLCGVLMLLQPVKQLKTAASLFLAGIFCFSGSLYLLTTRTITGISATFLGPITPIGGLLFIAGWLFLFVAVSKFTVPNKQ